MVVPGGKTSEPEPAPEVDADQPVRHYVRPGQLTGHDNVTGGVLALCGVRFVPPRPVEGLPALKAPICPACSRRAGR